MSNLKPCPFCESDAVKDISSGEYEGGHFIRCLKCDASTKLIYPIMDDVEALLIEAWNTRPTEHSLRSRVKELESQLKSERIAGMELAARIVESPLNSDWKAIANAIRKAIEEIRGGSDEKI